MRVAMIATLVLMLTIPPTVKQVEAANPKSGTAPAFSGRPALRQGARGESVATMQQLLALAGHSPGPKDGIFGPATSRALREAQQRLGLRPDGIAGPATAKALAAAVGQTASGPAPGADGHGAGESAKPLIHVVQPGESLSAIALTYRTGQGEIARANKLSSPDLIRVGRELTIPGRDAQVEAPADRPAFSQLIVFSTPPPGGTEPDRSETATAGAGVATAPYGAGTGGANPGVTGPAPGDGTERALAVAPGSALRREVQEGLFALTFNGGSDPVLTRSVLRLLKEREIRATFFVHGETAQAEHALVAEIAAAGHEIGHYGMRHTQMTRLSPALLQADLMQASAALAAATGREAAFFRPPGGDFNGAVQRAAAEQGLQMVLWTNVAARDQPGIDADTLAARVEAGLFAGAIVMLHDTRPATVAALPQILEAAAGKGLTSVTLSDLVERLPSATAQ